MAVDVSPGFLPEGVTSAALLTTISGPNPGLTPASVQNATIFTSAAGPIITSVAPTTAAQGATGRVVVIAGANFANDATASFGPGVTAGVSVDSTSQDWFSWAMIRATRASILKAGGRSPARIRARAARSSWITSFIHSSEAWCCTMKSISLWSAERGFCAARTWSRFR